MLKWFSYCFCSTKVGRQVMHHPKYWTEMNWEKRYAKNYSTMVFDKHVLTTQNGNTPFMLAVCRKSKRHKDIVKLWLEMEEGIPNILKTVSFDTNEVYIITIIHLIVYQAG